MFSTISTQANELVSLTKKKETNSKTKVIAITSGKGGVGKSTISANIVYLLAQKQYKVAILDADIGLANLQVLLNVKPKYTFFDYVDGTKSLDEIQTPTAYENITLYAGKSGYKYSNQTSSMVFSRIIENIVELNKYDILLIDTGAGLNEYVQEFLTASDYILAITSTDPSAITDAYAMIKMISKIKNNLLICFNHTKKYHIGETITKSIKDLARKNRLNENFMLKYIGNVNSSDTIQTLGRQRKLFTHEFDAHLATLELKDIVDNLLTNIKKD